MEFRRKYNAYTIQGSTVILQLTKDQKTVIDREELDRVLAACSWYAMYDRKKDTYYVGGTIADDTKKRKQKTIRLARFLLDVTDSSIQVDHINRNTLDNRKKNLRIVTNKQNGENRSPRKGSISGIRGVSCNRGKDGKPRYWAGQIRENNNHVTKYFPYTDEGLQQASEWVLQERLKRMTHSDMDIRMKENN